MLIYKYFAVKDPMVDPRYVFDYEIFIYQHLELLIFMSYWTVTKNFGNLKKVYIF